MRFVWFTLTDAGGNWGALKPVTGVWSRLNLFNDGELEFTGSWTVTALKPRQSAEITPGMMNNHGGTVNTHTHIHTYMHVYTHTHTHTHTHIQIYWYILYKYCFFCKLLCQFDKVDITGEKATAPIIRRLCSLNVRLFALQKCCNFKQKLAPSPATCYIVLCDLFSNFSSSETQLTTTKTN